VIECVLLSRLHLSRSNRHLLVMSPGPSPFESVAVGRGRYGSANNLPENTEKGATPK
jgi:hypothetical protein